MSRKSRADNAMSYEADMSNRVDLSIVLPCYRGAQIARRSVDVLTDYLPRTGLSWEVIVVDDGGGDFDAPDWNDDASVRLLCLPRNRGKGAAVRAGMLAARGRARIFTDVDLPYDLDLFPVIAEYLLSRDFHVVVGDRTLPASSYALEVGWKRRIASGLFSTFVGTMVTGGFFDTQCGLKGFRGDIADQIFALARVDRFAFDVELLYLALSFRTDIKRVPVRLRNNDTSSVRLVQDSSRMFADVMRIKYHQLSRRYRSAELAQIVADDFDTVRSSINGRERAYPQVESSLQRQAAE